MILYADASALVKRYLTEQGSGVARRWLAEAESTVASRVVYVEVRRTIGAARIPDREAQQRSFDEHWALMTVIDLSQELVEAAANLGVTYGLASLDAIHLASALAVNAPDLFLATFDRRLWLAGKASGMNLLPESLP